MAVYRFRIIFEDQEDVVREIEVLGKQTFEELHRTIQEAIGFDNSKDASFFISDDYWRKGQEITNRKAIPSDDDDDDDDRRPKKIPIKQMSASKVAGFIDDPHQKIVYVFDPLEKWTLLMELVKITADEPKVNYPRTVKSSGAAPKQYKQVIVPPVEDDDDEEDEEDKKAREKMKLFVAEEGYDEDAAAGAEEDKSDDAPVAEEESDDAEGAEDLEEGGDFVEPDAEEY